MATIVIPDDYPVVMGSSASFLKWRENTPSVHFDTLPGSEEGLLARIGHAEVVINIRSSTKFPATVFAACPRLKLLSLWGTGTDSVDLAAATRRHAHVQRRLDLRLRFAAPPDASQLGRNDLGVVEDQHVTGPEQGRQVAHRAVRKPLTWLDHQHLGAVARLGRA